MGDSNYSGVRGLEHMIFENDANVGEPLSHVSGAQIEEMYYDELQGNIQLTFTTQTRLNTWTLCLKNGGSMTINRCIELEEEKPDSQWVKIPIKANKKWNGFANSLPKWEDQ